MWTTPAVFRRHRSTASELGRQGQGQRRGRTKPGAFPRGGLPSGPPPERIVIEGVRPEVDEGRYPAKAIAGDRVTVEADIYADGHEAIAAVLLYRRAGRRQWRQVAMEPLGNDRWRAEFPVPAVGLYQFTIEAWLDPFQTWRQDLAKRVEAGQDVRSELPIGARMLADAAARARGRDAQRLRAAAQRLSSGRRQEALVRLALGPGLARTMARWPDRERATRYRRELAVEAAPARAGFGAWYEMFPRSAAAEPGRHGTFADMEARLPYVAGMGFDVLYLPPVHPIGRTHRKGKNNALVASPDDPGSPWAIGSEEGGHKAVHPQLGTLAGFRSLVAKAKEFGLEIALDIALQCSPDHPYVKEHPQWFRRRPDGTVRHAENPPKKYEDIYPLDFETEDWRALWREVLSIFLFWMEQGVRIFRVDNPHTKPFRFWEWLIAQLKRVRPDVILLSEAFTRPKIMYHLAKLGFTQSYTYFAWRNTKWELTEYFTELTQPPVADFFCPNVWPNTPDILTEYLQRGGRPAFAVRLILAATLCANYGIYGPAFELCENVAREPGSEEYLNSEKYEIKHWDVARPDSLAGLITRVNAIRRENAALHSNRSLRFHYVDNDQIICYSKRSQDGANTIVTVVNLDPHHTQAGFVDVPVDEWGVTETYTVRDLLDGAEYRWHGRRNYVELDPQRRPAHILRLEPAEGAKA